MKKTLSAALALAIAFSLFGCGKPGAENSNAEGLTAREFKTVFPLEKEAVASMLEEAGLSGAVSESEMTSVMDGHVHYVIRSETEKYAEQGNAVLVADVSAADYDGERMLLTVFEQKASSDQLNWEDWKKQIVFAALLYGGFEDEEEAYKAFADKELPAGEAKAVWDAQIDKDYCRVSYFCSSHKSYDENGFEVVEHRAFLNVKIYESYELYQKTMENQQTAASQKS